MTRALLSFAALALAATAFSGCVSAPTSPWEITLQFERSVSILDRATVAVRLNEEEEPASVLLNVKCEGELTEDRTVILPVGIVSPALCGLHFQLGAFTYRGTKATGANFHVTWGEDAATAPPQVIESESEEGSGE